MTSGFIVRAVVNPISIDAIINRAVDWIKTNRFTAQAETCCRSHCYSEEPFLRFLDDICCFPRGTCERNPYEERVETGRHDFTQSTTTVGRGVVQVEAGYLYLYKDEAGEIEQAHSTPETLLRIGLSDDIEFRIRWNYAWQVFDDEPNEESAQDMVWSFKLQITEQCVGFPRSMCQSE